MSATIARVRWALILLAAAGCTSGPAQPTAPRPHPYFPIATGDVHALARQTLKDGPIKCTSCHPLTVTNYAQFECTGCHQHEQARVDKTHAAVPLYSYASPACYSCHRDGSASHPPDAHDPAVDVRVTALVPTWSNATIVEVVSSEERLPMGMNHASAQIPAAVIASCSNCHPGADVGNYYPGQFHPSLLSRKQPQPTACADCHAASAPLGFVGPAATSPARTPSTGEMKHDAVAWDGGAPTTTPLLTADCSACHVTPSTFSAAIWSTQASFHAALTDAGMPQPGSCIDCHANTRPTGVISAADAGVPAGIGFDHSAPAWLGDCVTCHATDVKTWAGGKFHLAGNPPLLSCLPCHAGERPTSTANWKSPPSLTLPFDFVTNARGITHGDGQDCALCHYNAQGFVDAGFVDGGFAHGPGTPAAITCVACHSTVRPTTVVSGFDHATSGTGDCFGCHQATTAHTSMADWDGGQPYPGPHLMGSSDQFIRVTELTLKRSGPNNLVTGTTSTVATLYNAMLHTASELPMELNAGGDGGNSAVCWHCHTSAAGTTMVTSFLDGQFHSSLTGFRTTPAAAPAPFPQPTSGCTHCHEAMRPAGVVQNTDLRPMDHSAKFTTAVDVNGTMVTAVSELDCSVCHAVSGGGAVDGGGWRDGGFHTNIPGPAQAKLEDCVGCHYPLMADAAKVDVISAASPSFKMRHRSTQLTTQKCDTCHAMSLANATAGRTVAQWSPGKFHPSLTTQPGACVDCHGGVTTPTHPTQSAFDGQWMNHAVPLVTQKDCAFCHASDLTTGARTWNKSDRLHLPGISPTGCSICHGPLNGGANNNMPSTPVDSTTITSASALTGAAGLHDQISHADVNVTAHDCNFCHTQVGVADAGTPAVGHEWARANFHARFTGGTGLELNGSTGRCSNCHLNLKPGPNFTDQNHSAFDSTSTDCSSCHAWPGTGNLAAPNWHLDIGPPPTITVGGFPIGGALASSGTTQPGVNNLAHPAVPAGATCSTCHTQASGGRKAFGYDHALAPATGCASCHEAGSDLVGTPWTLNAAGAVPASAQCGRGAGTVADRGGDTRPVGIASLACSSSSASLTCGSNNCAFNHFYPSDCGECHAKPAAIPAKVQTGSAYVSSWAFQHYFGAPAQQATCCHCHAAPSCRP